MGNLRRSPGHYGLMGGNLLPSSLLEPEPLLRGQCLFYALGQTTLVSSQLVRTPLAGVSQGCPYEERWLVLEKVVGL